MPLPPNPSNPAPPPDKKRYEYRTILLNSSSADELNTKMEVELTKLGHSGWRVINIQTSPNQASVFLSFFILLEREL